MYRIWQRSDPWWRKLASSVGLALIVVGIVLLLVRVPHAQVLVDVGIAIFLISSIALLVVTAVASRRRRMTDD